MTQLEVTEESLRTAVDEAVFAQAVTLADKVAGFSAVGPQIEAIVDGIEVSVRVSPSGLNARCACPAPYREGAPCPHSQNDTDCTRNPEARPPGAAAWCGAGSRPSRAAPAAAGCR